MIVVAIIAILAAIAVPGFLRARKRSQASRVLNDLRLIDNACDMYAIETNKKTNDPINVTDWTNYLKKGSNLYVTGKDILGEHLRPANCRRYTFGAGRDEIRPLGCDRRYLLVAL